MLGSLVLECGRHTCCCMALDTLRSPPAPIIRWWIRFHRSWHVVAWRVPLPVSTATGSQRRQAPAGAGCLGRLASSRAVVAGLRCVLRCTLHVTVFCWDSIRHHLGSILCLLHFSFWLHHSIVASNRCRLRDHSTRMLYRVPDTIPITVGSQVQREQQGFAHLREDDSPSSSSKMVSIALNILSCK